MKAAQNLIIPILLASAIGGCSFLKETIGLGPRRPKVEVYAVEIKKVSMLALEMQVTVQVENPNDYALNFSRLRYNMVAENLPVAEGNYMEKLSIPASGTSLIKLPLTINASSLYKLVQMIADGQNEPMARIKATADFDTPFGPIEVDFDDQRPLRKLANKHP